MSLDMEAIENKSNISITVVLEKDFRIARAEAILKYNLKFLKPLNSMTEG